MEQLLRTLNEAWQAAVGATSRLVYDIAEWMKAYENHYLIGMIAVMVLVVLGIFLVMTGGVKSAAKTFRERRAQQTEDYVKQKHNRYITDRINLKVFRSLDDAYKYSRVYTKKRRFQFGNTSWNYFIVTNAIAFAGAVITFVILRNPAYAILNFVVLFIVRYGYLQFLRMKISREIENEIVLFLNLLSNYSTGNTEIISTFAAIAHKFKPNLRDCLLECVAESQGKGGTIAALENLGRKIESRKFKEVLKNLEISQKFNGSFHMTAIALRRDALEYVNEKKKLSELIVQNSITLGIIIASVCVVIVMMAGLLGEGVLEMIKTVEGFGCVAVMFAVISWIAYEFIKINKA